MNLKAIRTKFVTLNGRFDLVVDTTDYADNGADFFIQSGQRFLDSILPSRKSIGRYTEDIESGDYKIMIDNIQSIDSVYVKESGEGRNPLTRKSYAWIQEEYSESIANQDSGTPAYYSPIVSRIAPQQKDLTALDYTGEFTQEFEDILFGSTRFTKDGITFRPKADKAYTMTIFARFFSSLSDDDDISYHSEMYPELLIMASNMVT